MINEAIRFLSSVKQRLTLPLNSRYHLLASEDGKFTSSLAATPIGFVTSDFERDAQLGTDEDFSVVFNTWSRISRAQVDSTDADNPSELNAWVFDEEKQVITCTQNTSSLVGFISPELFENYTFEVELSSIDGDDDFIGVVIAYAIDPSTGQSHIITVMRGLNGIAPMCIDYNRYSFSSKELTIANVYGGLRWPTYDTPATGSYPGPSNGGGGWAGLTKPIKLRITRSGDNFTVETSDIGEDQYLESAKTTFTLNDHPELAVFKGPQRIGYCCASQRHSTWKTITKPSLRQPVIDLRNYRIYQWQNQAWTSSLSSYSQLLSTGVLKRNTMYFNPTTGRYYYTTDSALLTL